MKNLRSFAIALVLFGAASAWAQLPPVIFSSQPYASLTGATQLNFAADEDDDAITVPLGFQFTYFGTNYSSVSVSTNGVLTFDLSACVGSGCFTNATFPSTVSPNPAIAALWDDMQYGANTQIRYVQGASETTIEFFRLEKLSGGGEATFSVTFAAGGLIRIHYGTITAGTSTWTYSAGFENPAGTLGQNFFSCTTSCTPANFTPNQVITIGEPTTADLIVSSVTVDSFTRLPDDNLTFTVNTTVRNIGRSAAGAFEWSAYLSRDRVLDTMATDGGADILVASGTAPDGLPAVMGGVTADGGQSIVNLTAPAATTVAPPTGEYFVLVHADTMNTVTEATETNNVGSSVTAFVQGVDIVATSLSGPTTSVGGADAGVTVNFVNRGTTAPDAGVPFRVLLSNDNLLDNTDVPIAEAVRTMTGGQTINDTITFQMPPSAPAGEFFYILQIDPPTPARPNGVIDEASETNNWAASTGKVTITRSDLVAESFQFLDPVTNLPTTTARFGEQVRVRIRYRNAGLAAANNFRVGLVISTDSSLSLLSDTSPSTCQQTVATAAAGSAAVDLTFDCTLPLVDRNNNAFPTAQYFLFGQVDLTAQIYETNEQNNAQMLGPVRITAPGPDLAVTAVTGPASAGVGEIIPVTRSIRNLGNVDAPAATYRYVISANDIITVDDEALVIIDGANTLPEKSVTLTRGAGDTLAELVRLPASLTAGTYYIGCIVDPTSTVTGDLDPTNNALASRSMVVAASSLRIVNTQLPDAVIGRPYSYRLSAVGEQGASQWALTDKPSWMSIDASTGLLSGTPDGTAAQVIGFTATLTNSNRVATTRLALRILPATSGLEVLTGALPAVVNSSSTQYDFTLGAAGGVPPYSWRLAAGTLPTGITLTSAGTFVGAPRNTANGNLPITVEVRDSVGGRATRALTMRLI
ncbi:MAG: CARDB domain-containing protein, partial [Archangium sp.]